jgi:enoyl-CoA hydratase/carnithine racemase
MTVHSDTDGPIAIITIDRPEVRNAVDRPTADALADAFRAFDLDDTLRVAVLTGAHGTFCAGADLKAIVDGRGNRVAEDGDGPLGVSRLLLSKPTIAAVEGHAVAGGLELALWCDLRIGTETAKLGLPERRWGVPLIDGGTQRLPRLVGLGRALDLILTGRVVEADEALSWGLVTEVVAAGAHLERALEIADGLAGFPQQTLLSDRRAALEGIGLPFEDGLALEAKLGRDSVITGVAGAARFASGEGRGASGAGV